MNILPVIAESTSELQALYRDLHANPELGFEERRTSDVVVRKLESYGVDERCTAVSRAPVSWR